MERFSLFIKSLFPLYWMKKVKFLSNFSEPLGGPIDSLRGVSMACRNFTEQAEPKGNL